MVKASAIASTRGSTAPAGTNQPLTLVDQLRVSSYISADDRTAKRKRLEKDSGKPFGKAGQYQCPRGEEFLDRPLDCSGNR